MNYHFITIEGNIGAGKTTLAHLLSKHYNARLILEEFADNPFLPKFYENPGQYAFPLELFFMAERFKQQKELLQQKDMFQALTISDYLFTKCLLFAKVTLPDDEFRLYQRLFDIIHQQLVQPDILIYLHAPVAKLQSNIKKRNRAYEQNIQDVLMISIQLLFKNALMFIATKQNRCVISIRNRKSILELTELEVWMRFLSGYAQLLIQN